MIPDPADPQLQPLGAFDTARPSPGTRRPPKRWAILIAWLWPVAFQLLALVVFFRPTDPQITAWIRWRNFFRSVAGIPAYASSTLGLMDPNGLQAHAIMAAVVWPILLAAVTLTPIRRLPLAVHITLSILWSFGGCCLTSAI